MPSAGRALTAAKDFAPWGGTVAVVIYIATLWAERIDPHKHQIEDLTRRVAVIEEVQRNTAYSLQRLETSFNQLVRIGCLQLTDPQRKVVEMCHD